MLGVVLAIALETMALWASQKIILPAEKERSLPSVLALVLVGLLASAGISLLIPVLGWLISALAWLWLVKVWFRVGWLRALVIALLAVIILAAIALLVGLPFLAVERLR
ncbi:MAG: hypothetical protein DRN99_05840 [Thermoproteota archaeon]|nr:MAG: hypothetical protein DRN99_05840 [Candidatus Korarchaeota archaeon]